MLLETLHRDVERAVRLLNSAAGSPGRAGPSSPHSPSGLASTAAQHGLHRTLGRHGSSQGGSPASTELTEDGEGEEDEARDGFETVIESPLAVLAHLSSLKLNVSNDEESGSSFLPSEKQNQTAPEQYFATGQYTQRFVIARQNAGIGLISPLLVIRTLSNSSRLRADAGPDPSWYTD